MKSESKRKRTSVYFIAQPFIDVLILCRLYIYLLLNSPVNILLDNPVLKRFGMSFGQLQLCYEAKENFSGVYFTDSPNLRTFRI